ncbi:MAG: phage terminase large subunit [Spirochaetales bacterium]|nr:phage terminase large subunit [Spirochaetales bacterium]
MSLIDDLVFYLDNPAAYVEDIIGAVPTPQQRKVLERLPYDSAIAGKSGHGIGKTALEAWSILWFLPLHPFARVPCTAPTAHQLEDVLWPEIKYWLNGSSIKNHLEWTKTRLAVKGFEETWFAVPRSSNKPENLQGFHGAYVLYVIDEASGVPQEIMEVVEGALTNKGAKLLMMGNPTQVSGTFYDAFHKDRALYKTFTFNSEESSLVSSSYCKRIAKKYGKESDVYRVRVKGIFAKGSPDTLIHLDVLEKAIIRTVDPVGKIFIGVDPARFGDDESVICYRHGYDVKPFSGFHGIDTTRLAGEVSRLVKRIRVGGYDETIQVRIDDTGIGAGVTDQLRLQENKLNIRVVPVNFGGSGDNDYTDTASKMWGNIKSLLPYLHLPDDDDLIAQLSTRKYRLMPDGRVKLEKKEDMKKRGLTSPDRADALALCLGDFHIPVLGKTKHKKKPITAGMRNRKF